MKTLRLHSMRNLQLHEEIRPVPGTGDLLIRVTAVGICGSDLHWFSEASIGDAHLDRPLVLGHEFAGVIESGELKGQRVAVDPAVNCQVCEYCQEGNPNLCTELRFAGHGDDDGAMRQYMSWPAQSVHLLPDELSFADGAMLEPLGVAIHAVDLAHIRPGMSVGVFGCGPIGLLIMQVARAAGATQIYATDKLEHRVEAARAYGATAAFQVTNHEEAADIIMATKGRGVDVSFEAAGENEAVDSSLASVKRGGLVILAGIPSGDTTSFSASKARRRGVTFKLVRRMKHTYPRAIRLVQSGLVDVRTIVTQSFPIEQFEQAFAAAQKREGLKVIIEP